MITLDLKHTKGDLGFVGGGGGRGLKFINSPFALLINQSKHDEHDERSSYSRACNS